MDIEWGKDGVDEKIYILQARPETVRSQAGNQAELKYQLKGNSIIVDFMDGKIHQMQTKGSAENIYFTTDNEGKFIGVNHSNAQIISIDFNNDEPIKIVFINQLTGKMTPLFDLPKSELKLNNFKWQFDLKPISKFDILSPKGNE
jgi:phosphoenolpyruvate synthase/pyruvate phosphate dikinase